MKKQTKFVKVVTSSKTGNVIPLADVKKTPKPFLGYTWPEYRLAFLISLLVVIGVWIAAISIIRAPRQFSRPVSQTIPAVVEVEAAEPQCDDPISYIRCAGEKLGVANTDIRTMIRISQCESSHNPKAKNRRSSASGLFQITAGTWYSADCMGDKWSFKDSTDCAYKLYQKRGFQPWISSKRCWVENL